jgi:hypothetical protein
VACPELLAQSGGEPEVTIHYGTVPDVLESVLKRESSFELNEEEFLLKISGLAKYLVLGGREIIVEPAPGIPREDVRLFLLGSAFGALFYQRGLLPLHGCAIEVNQGAAVFLGVPGSGKSTLAGALHQQGYRVLTDDVSVLSFSPEGWPMVQPSCTHLKLSPEALKSMGKNPAAYSRVLSELEKYSLPLGEGFCDQPRPVKRIYELASHDLQEFNIVPLRGTDKLTVLITHTYRLDFLEGPLKRKCYFEQCGRLARQVPISRLIRPPFPFPREDLVNFLKKEWG